MEKKKPIRSVYILITFTTLLAGGMVWAYRMSSVNSQGMSKAAVTTEAVQIYNKTQTTAETTISTVDLTDFASLHTWRSALYPENWTPGYTNDKGQFLHDFSYAGYEKGETALPLTMPGFTANVVTMFGADNTGKRDSTREIQNAINAVEKAGGGTVYLPAGTYKVRPESEESAALLITGSNILFKGEGVENTFIRCYAEYMRNSQVIKVSPVDGSWDRPDDEHICYLSEDIPDTPTTTIYLDDTEDLEIGDWVIIRSDRTKEWIKEHSMSMFWNAKVDSATMGTTFYRQITSIDREKQSIEIDIPTRYNMKLRDNARVYKVKPKQVNVGLCDFSIGNKSNRSKDSFGETDYSIKGTGAYAVSKACLIKYEYNVNCFARNIRSYRAGNKNPIDMSSNGLYLDHTRSATIENCDFSYPQYEGGDGNGYGFIIAGQENLLKDCSSESARHSFSFKQAYSSGNVLYHFTSTNPKLASDFHMYLSMSNLIDNAQLNGDSIEANVRPFGGTPGDLHGYTSTQTVFWNTTGNWYRAGTRYIIDSRQFGYGYIIGTQGKAFKVKTAPSIQFFQLYGKVDTRPADYTEGIGQGATLEPQSLYYDQLERRLQE